MASSRVFAGDPFRRFGRSRDGVPLWWKVFNRNKKSVVLDLADSGCVMPAAGPPRCAPERRRTAGDRWCSAPAGPARAGRTPGGTGPVGTVPGSPTRRC
ncbi:CoA transferase [Streptomyces sp. NPDC088350]|uniref:CoA transferase n=1 Tax=Streptomyces sp. NPDC088350 TaxID=3365854 RepID=UPI00380344FF